MMRPGSIAHVLCFRHSFLRDMKEKIPASLSDNAFYYPYKLKPYEEGGREPSYRPLNLNVDYEYLQWDDADESRVTQRLDRIAANIEDCFLPWANGVDPATVKSELIEHGEGAWCERMWIDDYAARSDADRLRAPQIAP